MLPFLFLFFNAELMKAYTQSGREISVIKFVNNINILTYENITEENC
jgi:hypothetical protein